MSKVTNLFEYRRRRCASPAALATLAVFPPAVVARINSKDDFMSVELDISAFLKTADHVSLCAFLEGIDSWAAKSLVDWAAERHPGVRHLLEYVDITRDTEYETEYEVRVNKAQLRRWIDVHRPAIAFHLAGST